MSKTTQNLPNFFPKIPKVWAVLQNLSKICLKNTRSRPSSVLSELFLTIPLFHDFTNLNFKHLLYNDETAQMIALCFPYERKYCHDIKIIHFRPKLIQWLQNCKRWDSIHVDYNISNSEQRIVKLSWQKDLWKD